MEFDLLFKAMYDGDDKEINRLTPVVLKTMIGYLRFTYAASLEDAEDCSQDTIVRMMEFARERQGQDLPENAGGYARQMLKNYYLKTYRSNKKSLATDDLEIAETNNPYDIFIDKEIKRILDYCIEKLDEFHSKLIRYIFNNPEARATDVGAIFDLSESNVWVKRHRIQKQIGECVQKKV